MNPIYGEINPVKYHELCVNYLRHEKIFVEAIIYNEESWKNFKTFYYNYLKKIGSPEALQLIEDLKTLTLQFTSKMIDKLISR